MGFQVGGMYDNTMNEYFNQQKLSGKKDKGDKFDPDKIKEKREADAEEKEGVIYDRSSFSPEMAAESISVKKSQVVTGKDTSQLSDKAKALLEELQEKYDNMDFFVADVSSDAEANGIMSQGTKEYSVLIDPETLEKMAEDEDFKNQCLESLEQSRDDITTAMEELGEDAENIESITIQINNDGTTTFFAKLKEASEEQSERIKEQQAKKREEKEEEKKEEEKADRKERDMRMSQRVADMYAGRINSPYMSGNNEGIAVSKRDEEPKEKEEGRLLTAGSAAELVELLRERLSKTEDTDEQEAAEEVSE